MLPISIELCYLQGIVGLDRLGQDPPYATLICPVLLSGWFLGPQWMGFSILNHRAHSRLIPVLVVVLDSMQMVCAPYGPVLNLCVAVLPCVPFSVRKGLQS